MSTERKPGERWRVTFEGKIDRDGDMRPDNSPQLFVLRWLLDQATSAERLPDPEPDWQWDDICDDANGQRWQRINDRFWRRFPYRNAGPDSLCADHAVTRPLTPVMLGGKHVSEIEP